MTQPSPPPIYEAIAEQNGKAKLPWILFFNSMSTSDTGSLWLPEFTNLTIVGAAPTITGYLYKISDAITFFRVVIVPTTNTSAVAGVTYINNFPLSMTADGVCFAVSGGIGTYSGMCDKVTNRVYMPDWTTVTVPITIIGIVEAK